MVSLVNPFTGKTVEATGDVADRLARAGFTKVERDKSEPVSKRRPGRPKKSG